jgi:nitrile hydratase beta subunit
MNGVHDMGGMQGYGPVQPEPREPVFHADWERQALALTVAMGATGQWNIDQARSARESLPPQRYLQNSYYQIWLDALENMMVARGLATHQEITTGQLTQPGLSAVKPLARAKVDAVLAQGTSAERPVRQPARFAEGQRVRALNQHPMGHTRLPRYVRGHVGTVVKVHGVHVLPDRHAATVQGVDSNEGEWLYAVVFDARQLWGPAADPQVQVSVDAWESYLAPLETPA